MPRSRNDALRWVTDGTRLCAKVLAGFTEGDFTDPSRLPGWTRKHVVGHLAANGVAVGNLVQWARSDREIPMYPSRAHRDEEIDRSVSLSGNELYAWFLETARDLHTGFVELTEDQWTTRVKTALGRHVPATETPWMRAREVMVHVIDLDAGTVWSDLPQDFLAALVDDVTAMRSRQVGCPRLSLTATDTGQEWKPGGDGAFIEVHGPVASLAGYLTGRDEAGLTAPHGSVPALPSWI